MLNLNKYSSIIEEIDPIKVYGKVTQITGLIIEGHGPGSSIGEICDIFPKGASHTVEAEVVGVKGDRRRIYKPLDLGINAMNGLLACGQGQRLGIFAGSGVGKSVLLGMMARNTTADVNVIALVGERGREVKELLEKDLKKDGLDWTIDIVAPS